MSNLVDLVEVINNDMDNVLLKVKDNVSLDLIKLGFNGNETMIRYTKGRNHTITIWEENNKVRISFDFGASGWTLISNIVEKQKQKIVDCIECYLGIYCGENLKLRRSSILNYNKNIPHEVQMMYWDKEKGTNITVHKDGEFYRAFTSIIEAVSHFEDLGYSVFFEEKYIAKTGCFVEVYTIEK